MLIFQGISRFCFYFMVVRVEVCLLWQEFDNKYGTGWQCVVGSNFGCFFTHSKGSFIYFTLETLNFLIFKGASSPWERERVKERERGFEDCRERRCSGAFSLLGLESRQDWCSFSLTFSLLLRNSFWCSFCAEVLGCNKYDVSALLGFVHESQSEILMKKFDWTCIISKFLEANIHYYNVIPLWSQFTNVEALKFIYFGDIDG